MQAQLRIDDGALSLPMRQVPTGWCTVDGGAAQVRDEFRIGRRTPGPAPLRAPR